MTIKLFSTSGFSAITTTMYAEVEAALAKAKKDSLPDPWTCQCGLQGFPDDPQKPMHLLTIAVTDDTGKTAATKQILPDTLDLNNINPDDFWERLLTSAIEMLVEEILKATTRYKHKL